MNPLASSNTFDTPTNTQDWHTVSPQQVVEILKSNAERGFTDDEVVQRQKYFGKNELKQTEGRSKLSILWDRFTNMMLVMLYKFKLLAFDFEFNIKDVLATKIKKTFFNNNYSSPGIVFANEEFLGQRPR